jgi:hypothetical protein
MSKVWSKTEAGKAYHREYSRRWAHENRDQYRATRKAYEKKHHDKYVELRRAWRAKNIDAVRAQSVRRRLRKYSVEEADYQRLLTEQQGRLRDLSTRTTTEKEQKRQGRSAHVVH